MKPTTKPLVTSMTKIKDCIKSLELEVSDYLDHEDFSIVKIEDLGFKLPFQSHTFRPDFFSLAIVDSADCYFEVGSESYRLTSDWVLFTQPDVFVSCKFLSLDRAYYITFSAAFLKEYCYMHINKLSIPANANAVAFHLLPQHMHKIKDTCLSLYQEAQSKSAIKYEVIGNILAGLLLELQQYKTGRIAGLTTLVSDKETDMIHTFFLHLEKNFSDLALGKAGKICRTGDYALLQHVKSNYLSKMISHYTGKTINCWIKDKAIDDILYLLKHSNKSLKDISCMYGFYELTYFYAYFKKHAGISPDSYRKMRKRYHLDRYT